MDFAAFLTLLLGRTISSSDAKEFVNHYYFGKGQSGGTDSERANWVLQDVRELISQPVIVDIKREGVEEAEANAQNVFDQKYGN